MVQGLRLGACNCLYCGGVDACWSMASALFADRRCIRSVLMLCARSIAIFQSLADTEKEVAKRLARKSCCPVPRLPLFALAAILKPLLFCSLY